MTKSSSKYQFEYTAAKRRSGYSQASPYGTIEPGISVRAPYDRSVYEAYRPNEYIPNGSTQEELRQIMDMCTSAYERVGVIRSVIDMMSEFGAEGVEIIHPDAGPNEFYKAWSKKVHLEDRCERFLSWLFKSGNVVVRRKYGTIKKQDMSSIKRSELIEEVKEGRIPLEYLFYKPSTIELVGDGFASFVNPKQYAIRIPLNSLSVLRPKNALEETIYNKLPPEIKNAIEGKATSGGILYVPIPSDKVYVAYYKKDDTDIWAKSFIYSILSDVFYNDKLKMAKTSALDGWYNVVRLWKLGDHTHNLPPSPDDGEKLSSILQANIGGGAADIIWNSAIEYEEFYPPVDKLVNFEENIHSILLGLGVPENLVGGSTNSTGNSSTAYLGLKNLIKRLEAGRRAVREWLEAEVDIINKEMGFRKRPIIRFANADLHDEQTYFNLLIQLVDRGILSDETILERIDEFPEIEALRIKREEEMRNKDAKPEKASPFHKPDLEEQQQHEMRKIREQGKIASQNTENSSNIQKELRKETVKNGRPSGSRDSTKRSRRGNRMKATTAELLIEASKIYDFVDEYVRNEMTSKFAVANVRKMTSEQIKTMNDIKIDLFAVITPFSSLDEDSVLSCAAMNDVPDLVTEFRSHFSDLLKDLGSDSVAYEDKRILLIQSYVNTWIEDGV